MLNGSITYRNNGIEFADNRINKNSVSYSQGYADGLASAQNANIQYEYHYHEDSCYTLYANGNCNSCGKAGGSYPVGNTPTQCGVCKRSWTWVTNSTTNKLTCGYTEGQILSATIVY